MVKSILLGIAIALVAVFFLVYAIESFYPQPKYENYCDTAPNKLINSSSECKAIGGQWEEYEHGGWCDENYYCNKDYNSVIEVYERNVFFINLLLGLILLLIGFFIDFRSIGSGLMASGVIMIFYGTVRNWSNLSNILKTIVLGITLTILITLAYKKLKD